MKRKNIVITTVGSAGDILPKISLGKGLRERGYEVTILCAPIFEDEVTRTGLNFLPLGSMDDIFTTINHPLLWHPILSFYVIAKNTLLKLMRPMYAQLEKFDPEKTLLLASGLSFGARLAQEKRGFPLITIHLQSTQLFSASDAAEIGGFKFPQWLNLNFRQKLFTATETQFIDRILLPELNPFRKELGLAPTRRVFSQWMNSPEGILGLFPAWYSSPQPDWPPNMKLTGFLKHETGDHQITADVQKFLNSSEPPIVFTVGSANAQAKSFFKTAVEAVQQLCTRAILLTNFRAQLPEKLPETILHANWLPMSRILKKSAMIVHHGGIGTTAQALKAGIPQLIVPFAHDQFDNANRIQSLGVGLRVDPRRFKKPRVISTLSHLQTNTTMKSRARNLSTKIDFDQSLKETCDEIEKFLAFNT